MALSNNATTFTVMDLVELEALLRQRTGIRVSYDEFVQHQTMRKLCEHLQRRARPAQVID